MYGREPCKRAEDIDSIKELGLSFSAEKLVEDMSPEDLILSVRNHEIYKLIPCCDVDRSNIVHLVDEIETIVENKGFLRDDVINHLSPESRFVDRYVIELGLMGRQLSKCLPFYGSNEMYETYVFSQRRLKQILILLEEFLTKKQLREVRFDIYNPFPRRGAVVKEAKKVMLENREAIHDGLCKIFA